MKGKLVYTGIVVLWTLLAITSSPSHAQSPARNLTLLYSNNINGEIEPCPT